MDNAERLRRPPSWLASLARLAALVTSVVVLDKIAGTESDVLALVRLLAPLVL